MDKPLLSSDRLVLVGNLIPRFYDATEGEILVDGVNVKDFSHQELNNKVGYIPQKAVLFSGSIRSNMEFGESSQGKLEDEAIWKALELAQAKEFVAAKEKELDTEVAQGGTNFSGGQRQRLAIARALALASKPEFLILDEATSSVDLRTEELIQKAMDKLMEGRTSFVIAHRLSTIRNADLILVMKDGNIIEQGNHQELMSQNGFYADLYNSQFTEEVA